MGTQASGKHDFGPGTSAPGGSHLRRASLTFAKLEAAADAAHLRAFGTVHVPYAARARVAAALNHCIESATDAEKTYAIAATNVRDAQLRVMLHDQSKRRGAIVGELQAMLESLDCWAENEGSAAGALRRGLLDLKMVLGGRSGRALLAACVRADDKALAVFARARHDLSREELVTVTTILDAHRDILLAGRQGVHTLRVEARGG